MRGEFFHDAGSEVKPLVRLVMVVELEVMVHKLTAVVDDIDGNGQWHATGIPFLSPWGWRAFYPHISKVQPQLAKYSHN